MNNKPELPAFDWHIAQKDERAIFDQLMTEIYPLTPSTALVITNSFGGVPCDRWLVLYRYMTNSMQHGYVSMTFIDVADRLTDARNIARHKAWHGYSVDIAESNVPF